MPTLTYLILSLFSSVIRAVILRSVAANQSSAFRVLRAYLCGPGRHSAPTISTSSAAHSSTGGSRAGEFLQRAGDVTEHAAFVATGLPAQLRHRRQRQRAHRPIRAGDVVAGRLDEPEHRNAVALLHRRDRRLRPAADRRAVASEARRARSGYAAAFRTGAQVTPPQKISASSAPQRFGRGAVPRVHQDVSLDRAARAAIDARLVSRHVARDGQPHSQAPVAPLAREPRRRLATRISRGESIGVERLEPVVAEHRSIARPYMREHPLKSSRSNFATRSTYSIGACRSVANRRCA